ncbi:cobyric acid synthase [Propylenella binzhouense]|uniref:Cobyric acid synthase n=1 Tax=Propylenella binzhouense TaxID=2555902 RepID=A0A964T588_9HYPH|nr:cobyric acid synthase [Propylenella binzhouense]MYZ47712.1 cobyric acid synthase [Propylenella binzhouense]
MIQGTGSNVGKSLIVAGLCRALADRGLRTLPFKPQNMSNNAGVAAEGGEIGRAQMLQAKAARVAPSVHMNPVLLKPESETGAQVVVQGRRWGTLRARDYGKRKSELLVPVLESFRKLEADADLILVEGAGSPAETNLRAGDIANMGFAEAADVAVAIVGDIERGGVIASLVGTHAVLDPADRGRIKAFVINRFRGDPALFDEGVAEIARRTGWAPLGTIPHFEAADRLPAEDVLGLEDRTARPRQGRIRIAVPRLPRIANFDDLDPLRAEPEVEVAIVEPGSPVPADCALVLLPGSKSTIADLAALRREGWDIDIAAHRRRGGAVLGLCGGYQMLGRSIADPEGLEGPPQTVPGLGLLEIDTVMQGEKTTRATAARHLASGAPVTGYEIHMGLTAGPDCRRPFLAVGAESEGAVSADGLVAGCYLHGLFASDAFRRAFLAGLGATGAIRYEAGVEAALDALAAHLARHLSLDAILALAAERRRGG